MNVPNYGIHTTTDAMGDTQEHHVFQIDVQAEIVVLEHIAVFDDAEVAINFCEAWRGTGAPTDEG